MSKEDKKAYRNRMLLGAATAICALDCRHWMLGIVVAFGGIGLLAISALDRWLDDDKSGGSALDAQHAIKKGDPIGSYDAYAEWLAAYPNGYLYLKQAISALAWQLHKTGNLPMMRQAVDELTVAERALVDEKVKAPNDGR